MELNGIFVGYYSLSSFIKIIEQKKLMNLQNRFSKLNVAVTRFSEEY